MTSTMPTVRVDARNPDPACSPAWRWGRAGQLLAQGGGPNLFDDAGVHAAWAYLVAMVTAYTQQEIRAVREAHQLVDAAHRLYRDAGQVRHALEARLRAGDDIITIAQATGVDVAVVHTYMTLFFDLT